MNTKNITQEQISAFADGEMAESHPDAVLAALRQQEGRCTWDVYHHIGDVLRSDDMAFALRPDFAARLAARLEAEPTIVAPQSNPVAVQQRIGAERGGDSNRLFQRFGIPGAAAAAVAAIAFIAAPQLMVAVTGHRDAAAPVIATATSGGPRPANSGTVEAHSEMVAVNAQEGVILRDPRIDDYLIAHQRFSPSVYSTAQYARSAAFSNDSGK